MGLDYIRKESGKPWIKRWESGLDRLKLPTLFDMEFGEEQQLMTARASPNIVLGLGKDYVAQRDGEAIKLCEEWCEVARVDHAPEAILAQIEACGGCAIAKVIRVGLFGDTAEVQLR